MFGKMKVRTKLLAAFLAIGLLPFLTISAITLIRSSQALTDEAYGQLISLREVKKDQIQDLYKRRADHVNVLSGSVGIHNLLDELIKYHNQIGVSAQGRFDASEAEYNDIYQRLSKPVLRYMDVYGYYDVFVINAKHGHVMFTGAREKDLGANLAYGQYRDSGLANLWRKVKSKRGVVIEDFAPYAPSGGEPASFIGAPVMENG